MPHSARIPTPLRQHLHRFRLTILPVLLWLICVILVLNLWRQQAYQGTMVGEIQAQRFDVVAGVDGQLSDLEGASWQLFDEVKKGEVVAQLDTRAVQAQLNIVLAEIKKLNTELDAERSQLQLDSLGVAQNHEQNRTRLLFEVDRRHVEYLTALGEYQSVNAELKGVEAQLELMNKANSRREGGGVVSRLSITQLETQQKRLAAEVVQMRNVGREAKIQWEKAQADLNAYPSLVVPAEETVLGPIRGDIGVQEATLESLRLELDRMVIRAPADGVVSAIYHWPGQRVLASDLIMTIVRKDSQYIVSYVRERQRIPIREGMPVGLRLRNTPGGQEYQSTIETIGPHVEPVPDHQLVEQGKPEWATPIKIPLPPDLQRSMRPGMLLQVIMRARPVEIESK